MKVNLYLKYLLTNTTTYLINNQINNINHVNDIYSINISDINTYENILEFANISYNIYFDSDKKNYNNIYKNKFTNISLNDNTVKAFVYTNQEDTINVIAFKGTSLHLKHISNDVGHYDKKNDNLFFSCCYYKQIKNFNCYSDKDCNVNNNCKKSCYKESLDDIDNYYNIAKNIINTWLNNNNKFFIFTGHSLGGTLASMMGLTYNTYAIAFESPGDKNYIDLIGLKYNKTQIEKIYHYGHDADIIFTGKCNGTFSLCNIGGYKIETKCHIGNVCMYDVIDKLNIKESIYTHKMDYIIKNIITQWNNTLPVCKIDEECVDCKDWNYIE